MNDTFVDEAEYINIAMSIYNLSEYTSGSLWQFKSDEIADNANVTVANSSSFKYISKFDGNTDNNGDLNGIKIAVPLKYLRNFWKSLEMRLSNCKVELSLTWIGHLNSLNCELAISVNNANGAIANAVKATFKTKDAELYVPVVTLSKEEIVKLRKQLSEGFKRSV